MSALWAQGLCRAYGDRKVVDGVSLQVSPGQVVGLLGPNGAGKTTTFKLITGLEPLDAGELRLFERPLTGPLHQRVAAGLGYLPQRTALFPGLSVRQQLLLPLEARGAPAAEADRLLEDAGLSPLARAPAHTLSGGERRRLEIARCLATQPRVLLLDEPFAGVDPVSVAALIEQVRALARSGLGVLLTDHAAREALRCCDHVFLMDSGRVLRSGSAAEIAQDPEARRRWLGEDFGF